MSTADKAPLTERDLDVLCALSRVLIRDRRATIRAVAADVGLSVEVTHKRLRRLATRGLVEIGTPGCLTVGTVD